MKRIVLSKLILVCLALPASTMVSCEGTQSPAAETPAISPVSVAPEEVHFEDYEKNVRSEYGEDGVLEKIFEMIEPTAKYAIEFGASDGAFLSNTANLIVNHGWGALLIEGLHAYAEVLHQNYKDYPRVKTLEAYVYPGNVEILFEENGVPKDFDLLVIDIDSNDYYVWNVIHYYRPKVVQIEINPYFPPPQLMVIDFHPFNYWDESDYFGASIESMIKLGKKKGYEPIYVTSGGFNLFFVDRKFYARFGIKDNSAAALYKKWKPKADQWNRAPHGRDGAPFEKPFLDIGDVQVPKKFLFDR
jgi:hypothetical protein